GDGFVEWVGANLRGQRACVFDLEDAAPLQAEVVKIAVRACRQIDGVGSHIRGKIAGRPGGRVKDSYPLAAKIHEKVLADIIAWEGDGRRVIKSAAGDRAAGR